MRQPLAFQSDRVREIAGLPGNMKLLSVRLHCPDTLGDVALSFESDSGEARPLTLIFGGPGSGKTSLVAAVSNTRPAHTVALSGRPSDPRCYAQCSWSLGMDVPDGGRVLVLTSPNAPEELGRANVAERRELVLVERLAREGGFAYLSLSALRWFSRSAVVLTGLDRNPSRYEVRAREPLEDAARNDLTREVKQALAYAAVVRVLPPSGDESYPQLGNAMAAVIDALAGIGELRYVGLDSRSLEPRFAAPDGKTLGFDALPTYLKHCIAFGALTVRAAWSAYPGIDPRRAEVVAAIDEVDLHQDTTTAALLIDVLCRELPAVQWVLTTRSSALLAGRDESEVLALRRLEPRGAISVHVGPDAQVH